MKGRTEGLHCPPAQSAMPPLHRHECSDKLPQVLFERTPTQRLSARTTRCVTLPKRRQRSAAGSPVPPPSCRLFFFFISGAGAFTDAGLLYGMEPFELLYAFLSVTAGTEPGFGSRRRSFQLSTFCFPVAAREFHVYAVSDRMLSPPYINPDLPVKLSLRGSQFLRHHRTTWACGVQHEAN